MKELIGGCWLLGLLVGCAGFLTFAAILCSIGGIFAGAMFIAITKERKRETNWRKNYPSYKY